MKIYFYGFCFLIMCCTLFLFNRWAYNTGYETHRAEMAQTAAARVIKGRTDLITAGVAVQQTQHKMERKKTHDEMCRDILNYDVRGCLKP